jgi:hypothetical protein
MPRPEKQEKPHLPVPCCAIRAENLQLLTRRGLSAEDDAALIRPGRWLRADRRPSSTVGERARRTARSRSVRYLGADHPMYLPCTRVDLAWTWRRSRRGGLQRTLRPAAEPRVPHPDKPCCPANPNLRCGRHDQARQRDNGRQSLVAHVGANPQLRNLVDVALYNHR